MTRSARHVPDELVRHHLGCPADAELDDEILARLDAAREWYAVHGNPWSLARRLEVNGVDAEQVTVGGVHCFDSPTLADGLRRAGSTEIVLVAVSAGERIDEEVRRHWAEDRPDEAMFLNAFGSALAESLRADEAAGLAARVEGDGLRALPGFSPGYEGWSLAGQHVVFDCLLESDESLGERLEVLPSGGLRPSKSTLVLFGLTSRIDIDPADRDFWRPPQRARAVYAFPERALSRWSKERLEWTRVTGHSRSARFHFDGSTCSNMGLEFSLDYEVELERVDGASWRIGDCRCLVPSRDTGHRGMCAMRDDPDGFRERMAEPPRVRGEELDAALRTGRSRVSTGCLCTRADREHKWSLVLQTIHYAIDNESASARPSTADTAEGRKT